MADFELEESAPQTPYHAWYQTDKFVVVTVYGATVDSEELKVDYEEKSVS